MNLKQIVGRLANIRDQPYGLKAEEREALVHAIGLLKVLQPESASVPQWEYSLVPTSWVNDVRARTVEDYLNENGQFGWELCGIDYGCFIMKRRKT